MKVAIIGAGKTGGKLLDLIPKEDQIGPYNSRHLISDHFSELKNADVAISFLPGNANLEVLPFILEAKLNCIWGGTGFNWPENINGQLKENNICWVHGKNFAPGLNFILPVLSQITKIRSLFPKAEIRLEESHHIHKKDRPSGTAILWKEKLDLPNEEVLIDSIREGDIVGEHKLIVKLPNETLTLTHQAHDRKVFAQGALWAAEQLCSSANTSINGLHCFSDWINLILNNKL